MPILSLIQNPLLFLAFAIGLLIAITVHEFAHAWMANRCGDPTARLEGRLTLNPVAHLDLLGTIFLLFVGFGWGKPVPINPSNLNKKSDELKIALSGIVANIIVAFILAIPIRIALISGQMIDSTLWLTMLNYVVDLNIVLAVFNLLPISPLDGSHLVEYFLPDNAKESFRQYGPYILIFVLILDRVFGSAIIYTIMEPLIRVLSFVVKGTFSVFF